MLKQIEKPRDEISKYAPNITKTQINVDKIKDVIGPGEIPATGLFIGTPASISASVLPHILACDVEPFELNTSDTTRIAYGNSSSDGITGTNAFSANAPCPTSLLPQKTYFRRYNVTSNFRA